jgi:mono/diheme cytochrome c family protein
MTTTQITQEISTHSFATQPVIPSEARNLSCIVASWQPFLLALSLEGAVLLGYRHHINSRLTLSVDHPVRLCFKQRAVPSDLTPQLSSRRLSSPILRLFAAVAALLLSILLTPSPLSATPPNAENGKSLFQSLGCFRCHGAAGEGMSQPGNNSAPPKISGTHLSLQDFVHAVRSPKGQMPPFGPKQVSDSELADVYAFLHSAAATQTKLELPSNASPQIGQRLYTSFGCYECHGYQGQGAFQTGGSRIGPPQIPYSGFVSYVRQPAGQMPPYTAKAVTDAQLADIYSFLQSRPQAQPSKSIPLLTQ